MNNWIEAARFHEAGHALACWAGNLPVTRLAVDPDASGMCRYDPPDEPSPREAEAELLVDLAGVAAQEAGTLAYGSVCAVHDSQEAWEDARRIAARFGGSPHDAIARAKLEAERLVLSHWPALECLAACLAANGDKLVGDECRLAVEAALRGEVWQRPGALPQVWPDVSRAAAFGSLTGPELSGVDSLHFARLVRRLGTRRAARWREILSAARNGILA